jgi:hypothetical protein
VAQKGAQVLPNPLLIKGGNRYPMINNLFTISYIENQPEFTGENRVLAQGKSRSNSFKY